ncbi:SIMPL domain-containing protein [Natrialbaceae archaeon A-CW1-1]
MSTPTITTDGTGTAKAYPTKARVELEAVGVDATPQVATEIAEDRTDTITQSLQDAGVSTDQIRVANFRLEDPNNQFAPEEGDQYRVTMNLRVDCSPETASTIALTAIDVGASNVDVQFALDEETTRELRKEAVSAATARARSIAEQIADSEGILVGSVLDITTTSSETGFESIVDDALEFDPDSDFQPSPIPITERIEAVFEVTDE